MPVHSPTIFTWKASLQAIYGHTPSPIQVTFRLISYMPRHLIVFSYFKTKTNYIIHLDRSHTWYELLISQLFCKFLHSSVNAKPIKYFDKQSQNELWVGNLTLLVLFFLLIFLGPWLLPKTVACSAKVNCSIILFVYCWKFHFHVYIRLFSLNTYSPHLLTPLSILRYHISGYQQVQKP